MDYVSPIRLSVIYSGSNSSDILAMVQTVSQYSGNIWAIKSENESGLVLSETNSRGHSEDWIILPDTYVVVDPSFGIVGRITPAAGNARYRNFKSIFMDAVKTPEVIAGLKIDLKPQFEVGSIALPALLLGASTTLSVPLSGSFGATDYTVKTRAISGTNVLSMLGVTVTEKLADRVTVLVKSTGLASIAGVLLVDAYK